MRAAGFTGSASTLTCNLDVVNGSVSLIGSLPNCSAALCTVDGISSGMTHDCDGIVFLESCYANCSDGYAAVDVTSSTLSCGSNGFLVSDTTPFYPVCKVLSFPSSAFLDDTVERLDCSPLTLGEACVTCAVGYTAAGDTETTLTCVFPPELQGFLMEVSAHSCELAPGDLSTLVLPCTVTTARTQSLIVDLRYRWSLGGRPHVSVSHLRESLTCSIDLRTKLVAF